MPREIRMTLFVPTNEWTWTSRRRLNRGTYTITDVINFLQVLSDQSSTATVRIGSPQEVAEATAEAPAARAEEPRAVAVDLSSVHLRLDDITTLIRCLSHPQLAGRPNAADALAVLEMDGTNTLVVDTDSDDAVLSFLDEGDDNDELPHF